MMRLVSSIMFYILIIIFYFYFFLISSLYGIIAIYSNNISIIIYLIIPALILLLPFIIKYLFKINIFKFILIELLIHFILIICIHYSIINYMKHFTSSKWKNEKWIQLRHFMIDDFEDKYSPINKDKNKIIKILGNYNFISEECICYDVRLYKDIVHDTYCLYYNKDNIITNTVKSWER